MPRFAEDGAARMNYIKAASERLGVNNLDRTQKRPSRDVVYHCHLGKEGNAQAGRSTMRLASFDGVHFKAHVRHQPGAAEQTLRKGPIARSAFVEYQRPTGHLGELGALPILRTGIRIADK